MLAIAILAAAAGLALGLRFSAITLALLALAIVLTVAICVLGGAGPVVFAFKMLAALARFDHPQVADVVLSTFPKMEPELQPKAIELLTQRPSWARAPSSWRALPGRWLASQSSTSGATFCPLRATRSRRNASRLGGASEYRRTTSPAPSRVASRPGR